MRHAYVTGGTGFVGVNVVQSLLDHGWRVTALYRPDSDTTYLERLAAKRVPGDITDIDSLRNTMPMHPDAVVEDAFLSRAGWKIHKNALGVVLRRTLPGYALFKLDDDPYCQLRPYTLTEQYSGGGTFAQASGVSFGYVRYQRC